MVGREQFGCYVRKRDAVNKGTVHVTGYPTSPRVAAARVHQPSALQRPLVAPRLHRREWVLLDTSKVRFQMRYMLTNK